MAYKKNLGAMSSPFGENPNEGNIASENPMKLPPEEKSSMVTSPSSIANMIDEAYGGVLDGHNKAQDKLQKTKKPVVEEVKKVISEKKEPMAQDTKDEIIKNLIGSGMSIKSVFDDCIVAEINGKEIVISE